jgi:hypothetical protein
MEAVLVSIVAILCALAAWSAWRTEQTRKMLVVIGTNLRALPSAASGVASTTSEAETSQLAELHALQQSLQALEGIPALSKQVEQVVVRCGELNTGFTAIASAQAEAAELQKVMGAVLVELRKQTPHYMAAPWVESIRQARAASSWFHAATAAMIALPGNVHILRACEQMQGIDAMMATVLRPIRQRFLTALRESIANLPPGTDTEFVQLKNQLGAGMVLPSEKAEVQRTLEEFSSALGEDSWRYSPEAQNRRCRAVWKKLLNYREILSGADLETLRKYRADWQNHVDVHNKSHYKKYNLECIEQVKQVRDTLKSRTHLFSGKIAEDHWREYMTCLYNYSAEALHPATSSLREKLRQEIEGKIDVSDREAFALFQLEYEPEYELEFLNMED